VPVTIALLVVVSGFVLFPSLSDGWRIAIFLIPWITAEPVMTWFLRNRRELELVRTSPKGPDGPEKSGTAMFERSPRQP
jgi:hypothetical protein